MCDAKTTADVVCSAGSLEISLVSRIALDGRQGVECSSGAMSGRAWSIRQDDADRWTAPSPATRNDSPRDGFAVDAVYWTRDQPPMPLPTEHLIWPFILSGLGATHSRQRACIEAERRRRATPSRHRLRNRRFFPQPLTLRQIDSSP